VSNFPSEQDFSKMMDRITARAWSDEAFKQRLLKDPASVSAEYGMALPPGIQLRVYEDTDSVRNFVLPPRPALAELSDEMLNQVAGGVTYGTISSASIKYVPPPPPSCGSCW
jgi:hypothetical protein